MKNLFIILLTGLTLNSFAQSESMNGNVSATFGILNPKLRLQYERPLKKRASYGINANYYLVNWTGPTFEPFIRIYGKKDGNVEGFFSQFKLIYGNLSVLDYNSQYFVNKRWSTYGCGINFGYKFLLGKHFTIEPLMGFRFLSPPVYRYTPDWYANGEAVGESIGWYITTGLPFDLQVKYGFQF